MLATQNSYEFTIGYQLFAYSELSDIFETLLVKPKTQTWRDSWSLEKYKAGEVEEYQLFVEVIKFPRHPLGSAAFHVRSKGAMTTREIGVQISNELTI